MIFLGTFMDCDFYWSVEWQEIQKKPQGFCHIEGLLNLMRIHDDEASDHSEGYRSAVIQMGKLELLDKMEVDEILSGCYFAERKVA